MKCFRVWVRSVPGPIEQYDGHVDVSVDEEDPQEIFLAAVRRLRQTTFPGRDAGCWRMDHFVEIS